ncbi:MAG: cytidine deaminase [Armatimonadetes bacterium]|nr:cytidine deaminase [Armatimonadota bacterium]
MSPEYHGPPVDTPALLEAARLARSNSYAPYSVYEVGAAVLGEDGTVYKGCNVENASFGLTVCAERSAIVTMVGAGCRRLKAVAVSTKDGGTPCGMCLQTILEFAGQDDVPIWCADDEGQVRGHTLRSLLPQGFRLG